MLTAKFDARFARDLKRLDRKHVDDAPLETVISLILENTPESLAELKRRLNMHALSGAWGGSSECHVCNAGDWLLVWRVAGGSRHHSAHGCSRRDLPLRFSL